MLTGEQSINSSGQSMHICRMREIFRRESNDQEHCQIKETMWGIIIIVIIILNIIIIIKSIINYIIIIINYYYSLWGSSGDSAEEKTQGESGCGFCFKIFQGLSHNKQLDP